MSIAETVGLVLSVALIGMVVGAIAAFAMGVWRSERHRDDARRADAYARWLAARWTLTRASAAFATAYRALAAEVRDAEHATLRGEEVLRARSAWFDAKRELDQAQAALVVADNENPSVVRRQANLPSITTEMLRSAIEGDGTEFEWFVRKLHRADRQATELVRVATAVERKGRWVPNHPVSRFAASLKSIADRWKQTR